MNIVRNYSHHAYFGGWSEGNDFEIEGLTNSVIEHNVIYGSSWPIRGGGSGLEFRYNLVLQAGHEWMQPDAGISIHHNVFVGGDCDQGGLLSYADPANTDGTVINISNNTIDPMLSSDMTAAIVVDASSPTVNINSNAFVNISTRDIDSESGPTVTILGDCHQRLQRVLWSSNVQLFR